MRISPGTVPGVFLNDQPGLRAVQDAIPGLVRTSALSGEYRFPIRNKVQGVVFYDIGYAWDKRDQSDFDLSLLESGYGLGLRINSPLGPIKLDWGKGKQRSRFHFSFGGQF